jgi:hypothetical protein
MSDRIKGLTVTLKANMRDDDAQPIIDAIKMLRGVLSVDAHVEDMDHYLAKSQLKSEYLPKLIEIFMDKKP